MGGGALSAILGRQLLSADLQDFVVTGKEVGPQQFLGCLLLTQGDIARSRTRGQNEDKSCLNTCHLLENPNNVESARHAF